MRNIHFDGGRNLQRKLDKMSDKMEAEVQKAVKKSTYKIERSAKFLAPVDTGHMRRNIKSDFVDGDFTGEVSVNVEYAHLVEFGTLRQFAKPFLMPSYHRQSKQFLKDLEKLLKKVGD